MKKIGLLKENNNRSIVALSPMNIKKLVTSYIVLVEKNAGIEAGFSDEKYKLNGAEIVENRSDLIEKSDLLITYASEINLNGTQGEKTIIGCYHVLDGNDIYDFAKNQNTSFFSLDLLPRTTLAQSMDILSSLASLSGYQAVMSGLNFTKKIAPMISGAGGTLQPAKVLVLGVGVAGLQAIATAKRLGAIVSAFDVRKQTKQEVESLGATFIEIEGATEDHTSGGYAIEQAADFNLKIQQTIANNCADIDLIITTAKIPGKKAPILITHEAIRRMKTNSVIVDLASSTGGNIEPIAHSNPTITILPESELFNTVGHSASILLGNNITAFLTYLSAHEDNIHNDAILSAALVSENGNIINQRLLNQQ